MTNILVIDGSLTDELRGSIPLQATSCLSSELARDRYELRMYYKPRTEEPEHGPSREA